jgi:hypothetical protein
MSKLQKIEGLDEYIFYCPACNCYHGFKVPPWTFDGNMDSPTVGGSLRSEGKIMCHLFIIKGQLKYERDSKHQFAGKTIDMKEEVV